MSMSSTSTEENKAIARRHFMHVLEQGRVELIEGYYAPDGSVPDMETPQKWRDLVLWWHKAAPGFKITILDMMAEGDKVMVHWRADVTYTVPQDPPPVDPFIPLGKPVSWRAVTILRIVDGKLVSREGVNGWTEMLVKEGVIPARSQNA